MTNEERKKIYQLLAAPFPEGAIERTFGRVTGKGYDTVGLKWIYLVSRLNDALGIGGWRMHRTVRTKAITTPKGRQAYESIADVTIELGSWSDGSFVAWADAVGDGGHISLNEADSIKGAVTGAVKRALSYYGCGRQAYEGSLDDDNVPAEHVGDGFTVSTMPTQRPDPTPAPQQPVQQVPQQPRSPPTPSRNRLTSAQLGAIQAIARKLGLDQASLRAATKQRFNSQPEFLSKAQASQFISALSTQANGNGHDAGEQVAEPVLEG